MLLECSCGKMFRVREGTAVAPTKCPACGGTLRPAAVAAGAPTPAPGAITAPSPRLRELEGKVAELERSASAARAAAELKAKELDDMAERLAQAQKAREEAAGESARLKSDLQKREGDSKGGNARIQALEKELQETRLKSQQSGLAALKEKDAELHYAQERIAALERELGEAKGSGASEKELAPLRGRVADLESAAQEALRVKEAEHKESQEAIARLGDELKKAQDAYKTTLANKEKEVEDLHNKITALEMQVAESAARAQGGGKLNALIDQKNHDLGRAQQRITMLEKIVQDGEQRYRALQEELQKVSGEGQSAAGANASSLAEKVEELRKLQGTLSEQKAANEDLRRMLDAATSQNESLRSRLTDQPVAAPSARVGEARGLAGDLDRTLGGVSTSLQGLIDLVRRLNEALREAERSQSPATAPLAPSRPRSEARALPPPSPAPAPVEETASADVEVEGEEAVELESLPEPAAVSADEGGLPQDETLLDLGGAGMGKKVRQALREKEAAPAEAAPAQETEEVAFEEPPAEMAPSVEGETEPAALEGESEPAPDSEGDPDKPKKKGLFGKLFGRKK